MTSEQDRLEYHEKMYPKWLTILILTFGLALVWFVIPLLTRGSWAWYLGIVMCLLLIVLSWKTSKKSVAPKMTIDKKIIKTTQGQTFNTNSITNAELIIKSKWSQHKSHYIKLFFVDKSSNEFPVDRLDSTPQDILTTLKSVIGEQQN